LVYTGLALALMNVIFGVVLWDVAWFNTRGVHAFPLAWLFWMIFPLIALLMVMFFWLARRADK